MNLFSYIKQRVPILDVISEYATLKRAGLYFKGCCPFHHERTPSFTVSPHKEIFYCFGCHAGGDVISFIAKIEHCSPLEAARHIVDRYQLQLPETIVWEKGTEKLEQRTSYYQTCTTFAHWCMQQLAKNRQAQEYLESRTITKESIKEFGIGFCPRDTKSLLTFGQKENVLAQNFIDAQILQEGRTGLYSSFEERIIFPLKDHLGRIVGFSGRVFKENDERVKYYNSHDHAFFNKSSILYGLDRAKKAIAQKEAVFLVEGYTDLIIMHQYGYINTVATMGTACTPEHLKLLARYAQFLYIMYDGDAAGQNAVMRLVELCWQAALDPYVIPLPPTDDPATFLLAGGNMEEKLSNAQDIFSFVVHNQSHDFSHKSLQEKLNVVKKIIGLISTIPDPLKRDLLMQQASETFAIPLSTLARALSSQKTGSATRAQTLEERHSPTDESEPLALTTISQLEKKLFSAIISSREPLKDEDLHLLRLWLPESLKNIFELLLQALTPTGLNTRALFERLTEDEKKFITHCIAMEGSMRQALNAKAHEPSSTGQDETSANAHRSADRLEDELDAAEIACVLNLDEILTLFYKKQWKLAVHNVKLTISEAQQIGNAERVKQLLHDFDILKKKMLSRGVV